jgi:hypothetical protein
VGTAVTGLVGSLVGETAVSVGAGAGGIIVGAAGSGIGSRPVQAVESKIKASAKKSRLFIMFQNKARMARKKADKKTKIGAICQICGFHSFDI